MDDSALTKLLGNIRKTTYADGVRQSVEYYQRQAGQSQ
jgi:hypothetical protein